MAHNRRIRFARQLTRTESGADWTRLVRDAEAGGYGVVSLPDHLGDQFAALPALAAAAAVTTSLRLSMFVLANDLRHPAVLAKDVATLDVLSGGRVELGIGAGWDRAEYAALGIPFDSAAVRIDRLAEAVTLLRGALSGEVTDVAGTYYNVSELVVRPRPVQQPVPIVLGGGGRRMLGLAAMVADTVSISTNNRSRTGPGMLGEACRSATVRTQVGWIRDAAGPRFDALELNVRVLAVAVAADRDAAARTLAASAGATAEELLDSPFAFIGTPAQICDQIMRTRDELSISYFTVSDRHAAELAPVIEQAVGR